MRNLMIGAILLFSIKIFSQTSLELGILKLGMPISSIKDSPYQVFDAGKGITLYRYYDLDTSIEYGDEGFTFVLRNVEMFVRNNYLYAIRFDYDRGPYEILMNRYNFKGDYYEDDKVMISIEQNGEKIQLFDFRLNLSNVKPKTKPVAKSPSKQNKHH